MSIKYADFGITFETETVSRADGNTKIELRGAAQIPVPTDWSKIVEHFGDACIMGSLNGTSWRVMAQDVCRQAFKRALANGTPVPSEDDLQTAVYNRIRGIRNSTGPRATKVLVKLPNGTTYTGSDVTEYRQLCVACLVDMGVPSANATAMASSFTL